MRAKPVAWLFIALVVWPQVGLADPQLDGQDCDQFDWIDPVACSEFKAFNQASGNRWWSLWRRDSGCVRAVFAPTGLLPSSSIAQASSAAVTIDISQISEEDANGDCLTQQLVEQYARDQLEPFVKELGLKPDMSDLVFAGFRRTPPQQITQAVPEADGTFSELVTTLPGSVTIRLAQTLGSATHFGFHGIAALEEVRLNGGAVVAPLDRQSGVSVASNTGVRLNGGAKIDGSVHTAGSVLLIGNATITGEVREGALPFVLDLPDATVEHASTSNDNASIPLTMQGRNAVAADGVLRLNGQDSLDLATGAYYLTGLRVNGGATLRVQGPVQIFLDGGATFSGGSQTNATAEHPLQLISRSVETITITGSATAAGIGIYAPAADVRVNGGGAVKGSVAARNVTLSGGAALLYQPGSAAGLCSQEALERGPIVEAAGLTLSVSEGNELLGIFNDYVAGLSPNQFSLAVGKPDALSTARSHLGIDPGDADVSAFARLMVVPDEQEVHRLVWRAFISANDDLRLISVAVDVEGATGAVSSETNLKKEAPRTATAFVWPDDLEQDEPVETYARVGPDSKILEVQLPFLEDGTRRLKGRYVRLFNREIVPDALEENGAYDFNSLLTIEGFDLPNLGCTGGDVSVNGLCFTSGDKESESHHDEVLVYHWGTKFLSHFEERYDYTFSRAANTNPDIAAHVNRAIDHCDGSFACWDPGPSVSTVSTFPFVRIGWGVSLNFVHKLGDPFIDFPGSSEIILRDAAKDPSIIWHEATHNIAFDTHWDPQWTRRRRFEKATEEAMGDFLSADFRGDPRFALWRNGGLRELDVRRRYPQDLFPPEEEHETGRIWSTTLWDLRARARTLEASGLAGASQAGQDVSDLGFLWFFKAPSKIRGSFKDALGGLVSTDAAKKGSLYRYEIIAAGAAHGIQFDGPIAAVVPDRFLVDGTAPQPAGACPETIAVPFPSPTPTPTGSPNPSPTFTVASPCLSATYPPPPDPNDECVAPHVAFTVYLGTNDQYEAWFSPFHPAIQNPALRVCHPLSGWNSLCVSGSLDSTTSTPVPVVDPLCPVFSPGCTTSPPGQQRIARICLRHNDLENIIQQVPVKDAPAVGGPAVPIFARVVTSRFVTEPPPCLPGSEPGDPGCPFPPSPRVRDSHIPGAGQFIAGADDPFVLYLPLTAPACTCNVGSAAPSWACVFVVFAVLAVLRKRRRGMSS